MEQARKNLKNMSIVVLLLAAATLVQIVTELMLGELNSVEIPAGSPDNILLITKVFIMVITLLMLIPSVYVGIKGLRVAKNPNKSKGHIVWAVIILVFSASGIIEPATAILEQGSVKENVSSIANILIDVVVYVEYVIYARQVRELAE